MYCFEKIVFQNKTIEKSYKGSTSQKDKALLFVNAKSMQWECFVGGHTLITLAQMGTQLGIKMLTGGQ